MQSLQDVTNFCKEAVQLPPLPRLKHTSMFQLNRNQTLHEINQPLSMGLAWASAALTARWEVGRTAQRMPGLRRSRS